MRAAAKNLSWNNSISRLDERGWMLKVIQPGLAGCWMVPSPRLRRSLPPHSPRTTPIRSFSSAQQRAVGAGISMAFSEGLSDDGTLTGRGNPVFRGIVTGLMTSYRRLSPHAAVPAAERPYRADLGLCRGGSGAAGNRVGTPALLPVELCHLLSAGDRRRWTVSFSPAS